MKLFDNLESRDLCEEVQYTSPFEMINKAGGFLNTRRHLENWFKEYPSSGQKHLHSRFRGSDLQNHRGALFELVLHAFFVRLGCQLQVLDVAKPDFAVHYRQERFFLEATSVGEQMGPFTQNHNEEKVIKYLEELTSSYFDIAVNMEGKLSSTLGKNAVCQPFAGLLNAHRQEEVQRQIEQGGTLAAPSEMIECGDWRLTGYLVPIELDRRHTEANRKIKTRHAVGKYTDALSLIRKALRKKSKKYRTLDAPLIVAVNASDMFYNGKDNDEELLFGDQHYMKDSEWSSPKMTYRNNGLWFRETKRIDAIIRFQKVDVFNLASVKACLYLNPWKTDTVLPSVLLRLPHAKICRGKIKRVGGEDVPQILGIGISNRTI